MLYLSCINNSKCVTVSIYIDFRTSHLKSLGLFEEAKACYVVLLFHRIKYSPFQIHNRVRYDYLMTEILGIWNYM